MSTNPEVVIRKLDSLTTIFSVPFARGGKIPFGGRSTAITLTSLHPSSTFLIPSHPLCTETISTLSSLPPVKFLVSPDLEHHLYLKDYAEAYPDAKLCVPKPVLENWKKSGLTVLVERVEGDGFVFGDETRADPFPAVTGGEIESVDFGKAFVNQDIAFLHKPTRTLIEADLLFNLPPTEQYSKTTSTPHVPFKLTDHFRPGTGLHKRALWYLLGKDRAGMAVAAKKVSAWDFDRVIPCHGDVIETGGKHAWDSTYEWFLEMK